MKTLANGTRKSATNSYHSGEPVKMKLWLQISGKMHRVNSNLNSIN